VSRVQLALNVDDVDDAVAFYSRLFDAEPAKRRPGYANFALDEPALKLVLIENPGSGGSVNHLGVEVASPADVVAATRRLAAAGLATEVEDGTTCCYALQDKVWVTGPGAERWEVYTVLADAGTGLEGSAAPTDSLRAADHPCCAGGESPDEAAPAVAGTTACC
jgi:catechol 2,3-dioxygenase-like lactoylglutathione lyase family enzyme